MNYFFNQLLNGLSGGTIYALIALGFVMVYGVLGFLNFAHSEIFTIGVFTAYFTSHWALKIWPNSGEVILLFSAASSIVVCSFSAILLERMAYRPLYGKPKIYVLLTAIGISIFLQKIGVRFFGAQKRAFPVFPLAITPEVFATIVLIVSFMGLWVFINHTILGIKMRAVAESPETARLMGCNPNKIAVLVFILGGAFAGIAGVVWGCVYGTVHPEMGFSIGLKAFIIAVIGGRNHLIGVFLFGICLGVIEALISAYIPSTHSQWQSVIVLLLLMAMLMVRPQGLFSCSVPRKV